ncbi:MAG: DNA polymerase III subunit delta' [Rhizobiaceae bacterium]|nr:DNA polymerase III subunit delta' [Rhizobiaceae bacterium]
MTTEFGDKLVADRIDELPDPSENMNLIGHGETLDLLADHLASGRMHHAWLLSGPKGIGKATTAFRFAGHVFRNSGNEVINPKFQKAEEGDLIESKIAKGGHPNLLHLSRPWDHKTKKFKTMLTVDEIRQTRKFFGMTPGEKGWRICIIDSADEMNANAANALLKILEEPPAQTLFMVISHAAGRLLPTIRSRCQMLPMKPLDPSDVLAIAGRFGALDGISPKDQELVGQLSGGSVRRALVLLNLDGIALFRQIETILQTPQNPDWSKIHILASQLAPRAQDEKYRLFLELMYNFMHERVRGNSDLKALTGWAELWEKTTHAANLTDSYNLDRKQTILSLFKNMAAVA